jgi:hypothetical protein
VLRQPWRGGSGRVPYRRAPCHPASPGSHHCAQIAPHARPNPQRSNAPAQRSRRDWTSTRSPVWRVCRSSKTRATKRGPANRIIPAKRVPRSKLNGAMLPRSVVARLTRGFELGAPAQHANPALGEARMLRQAKCTSAAAQDQPQYASLNDVRRARPRNGKTWTTYGGAGRTRRAHHAAGARAQRSPPYRGMCERPCQAISSASLR